MNLSPERPVYLGVSPSWKMSGWWWAALTPTAPKCKLPLSCTQKNITEEKTMSPPEKTTMRASTEKGSKTTASKAFSFVRICKTLRKSI
jgi:hypothetical protein